MSPVFEGWTVDVQDVQVKPVGAPRGKSAAKLSAAQLAAAKQKAQERWAAAQEGEPKTKLVASYLCDLCSAEQRGPARLLDPLGVIERHAGVPLTSFPQGLISHRTGLTSCVRETVQTLAQLQSRRAQQPRSERVTEPRYSRVGFFAEAVPAKASQTAAARTKSFSGGLVASGAAATGKRKAKSEDSGEGSKCVPLTKFFTKAVPAPAPEESDGAEESEAEGRDEESSEPTRRVTRKKRSVPSNPRKKRSALRSQRKNQQARRMSRRKLSRREE